MRLHHVQVSCPPGGEVAARRFYGEGLGMAEAADLDEIADRLGRLGFEVDWTERDTFDGYQRFHRRDGAGNRVEILTPS
jgi:catechol 2,3-dioxygenase-like lactoylglutathione lyase family enzyme